MRAISIAFAVLVTGCGRTATFDGVPDPSAVDAGLTCDRVAGIPEVDEAEFGNGAPMKWRPDACINVSYDVELEPLLPDLRVALSDWSFPHCTWMCFTAPTAGGGRPTSTNDRRIHLGLLGPADQLPGLMRATTEIHSTIEGQIFSADMLITKDLAEPGKAPLLTLLGQVLGFQQTTAVDSVLNDRLNTDAPTSLRPADEQSVCAVYPSCR